MDDDFHLFFWSTHLFKLFNTILIRLLSRLQLVRLSYDIFVCTSLYTSIFISPSTLLFYTFFKHHHSRLHVTPAHRMRSGIGLGYVLSFLFASSDDGNHIRNSRSFLQYAHNCAGRKTKCADRNMYDLCPPTCVPIHSLAPPHHDTGRSKRQQDSSRWHYFFPIQPFLFHTSRHRASIKIPASKYPSIRRTTTQVHPVRPYKSGLGPSKTLREYPRRKYKYA